MQSTSMVVHKLPWDYDAMEPYISKEVMHYHFDKHHQGYVSKYNAMVVDPVNIDIVGLPLEMALPKLVEKIRTGHNTRVKIFENGAQAWNHDFLWHSMARGTTYTVVQDLVESSFGTYNNFRHAFIDAGTGHFGSGWLWLVLVNGKLDLCTTANADTPNFNLHPGSKTRLLGANIEDSKPLAVCDLWEHAYYLQYKNDRATYLGQFIDHLLNWNFVAANLANP